MDQDEIIMLAGNSSLFKGMNDKQIGELLKMHNAAVREYPRGGFVFEQQQEPHYLYVVLEGKITIGQDTLAGNRILITTIDKPGELFGEVYVFIRKAYDIYAQCSEDSKVLAIDSDIFKEQVQSETNLILRENLMQIFARKAYMINRKVRVLGGSSIRGKIARFLYDNALYENRHSSRLSREELADYLNVARPSLSRELGKMQDENIIRIEGREIMISNLKKLESYL